MQFASAVCQKEASGGRITFRNCARRQRQCFIVIEVESRNRKFRLDALLNGASALPPMKVLDVEAATTSLQKLLRFTAMRGKQNALAEARDLATVTAVSNLYVVALNLRPLSGISGALAMGGLPWATDAWHWPIRSNVMNRFCSRMPHARHPPPACPGRCW
jgi:hypothetical protein